MTTFATSPAVVPAQGRSFYGRMAALGFGLIAVAGVLVLLFGALGGDVATNGGFGIAFVVVGLLVAGAVWRFGRWALVVAAVLSLLLLGLTIPFSVFTLAHPESAGDFVPLVVSLAGALLGLVGSVGALVQARRQSARAQGTAGERWAVGGLLGVVAVASVLSIILTLAGRTAVSADAKSGAVSVQMHNTAFAPNALLVSAGDTVRVVVKNDDATLHTFTLPEAGVDVSVPPGSEKVIAFKAPAAGTYQWFCIPHSNLNGAVREGMVGTLSAK